MQTENNAAPSDERMHPMGNNQRNFIEHLARYDFAKQFLKKNMRVLDAACGMGYGSHLLSTMGCVVTGGDVSNNALEYCRSHYNCNNLNYLLADCRKLDFPDESFDVYVSFETIEHFIEQDEYLREARRILKKGGVFICSTPNKEIHEFYRKKGWLGPNPYHLKELTFPEFKGLLGSHFDEVEYYGQDFDPLALKMREVNSLVSELRWEMNRLPLTLIKSLLPAGVRKWLAGRSEQKTQLAVDGFSLDMIKISKLNIDNADTILAVCKT